MRHGDDSRALQGDNVVRYLGTDTEVWEESGQLRAATLMGEGPMGKPLANPRTPYIPKYRKNWSGWVGKKNVYARNRERRSRVILRGESGEREKVRKEKRRCDVSLVTCLVEDSHAFVV